MEQNPYSEANNSSATQETPRMLRNSKGHCRMHKQPPPVTYPEPDQSSPGFLISRF